MTEKRQWLMFDCPFCQSNMLGVRQNHLQNRKGPFIQTWYKCGCGYMLVADVPYAQAITIVDKSCFGPPEKFVYVGRGFLDRLWHRLTTIPAAIKKQIHVAR